MPSSLQHWDDYLSSRASSWTGDGLGLFEPSRPLWKRLLLKKRPPRPLPMDDSGFPKDEEAFLGGTGSQASGRRPLSIPPRMTSSNSSRSIPPYAEVDEGSPPRLRSPPPLVRPSLPNRSSVSLSGATVVDAGLGVAASSASKAGMEPHDVHVEDISHRDSTSSDGNYDDESPRTPTGPTNVRRPLLLPPIPEISPSPTGHGLDSSDTPPGLASGADEPHTPSLIRAFERIERARADARSGGQTGGLFSPPSSPPPQSQAQPQSSDPAPFSNMQRGAPRFPDAEWDAFWNNVRVRASTYSRPMVVRN